MRLIESRILAAGCLLAPVGAVLVGSPLAGLPFTEDPRGFWAPYTLLAVPVYVALLAAPGFLAALFGDASWLWSQGSTRWWIRTSLAAGLLCSMVAVIAGLPLWILFLPVGLVSSGEFALLLWRFERYGRCGPPDQRGIDRISRDKAAKLLDDLVACRISNDRFDEAYPRGSCDSAIGAVFWAVWGFYDDLHEHKLEGSYLPSVEGRAFLERCSAFLKTELPYEWPWYATNRWVWWAARRLKPELRVRDDLWPFTREDDLKRSQ